MHWLGRHRRVALLLICAVCTGLVIASVLVPGVPFADIIWSKETAFRDELARQARRTAARSDFVFLGIDEVSKKLDQVSAEEIASSPALQAMRGGFPWPRTVYAELLDRLCDAGAKLVMFDLIFGQPQPADEQFAQALARYRERVVLGANFSVTDDPAQGPQMAAILPDAGLIPEPQLADDRVGYVNYFADADARVREVWYRATERQLLALISGKRPPAVQPWDAVNDSFTARALRKLGHVDRIPRDNPRTIRFGPSDAYAPRSFYQVFVPALWQRNFANGAFFKDKIVLVGSASAIDHDVHPTPISDETPGPLLHLHALAAALGSEFLQATAPAVNLALLLGAGLLAWLLVVFVRQTLVCLLLLAGVTASYLGAAVLAFDRAGVFLLTLPVLGAFNLSGLFSLGYDFTLERLEKIRTRRTLERYVSKNIVQEVLDNPSGYYSTLRGSRKAVTILFSDLVGFTSMTENAEPAALVAQLNEYLSEMVGAVFAHEGTLDKFIGDAVMAVWGNVHSRGLAEDAQFAARSALAMRERLATLNTKWRAAGIPPLGIGIGLNHGDAIVGNIGSHERMDPTVIGDAVNLASRIEGLTRTYGVDILVGQSAAVLLRDRFHLRTVARVQVKGKTEPVEISALLGEHGASINPELLRALEIYERGVTQFRAREFAAAAATFSDFLAAQPRDFLGEMYLARAQNFEREPPAADWDGVDIFKKK